jgi:hypothetical protein
MTKKQFCEKYNLDINKRIFLWLPDGIQCQHNRAQEVYRQVCNIDNVIVKLHPHESRGHKINRFGNKFSYQVFCDKNIPVLEQDDTSMGYKYVDAWICYQSSSGQESCMYDTPAIYVDHEHSENLITKVQWQLAWIGGSCKLEELHSFVKTDKYIHSIDKFSELRKKVLYDHTKPTGDILADQCIKIIKNEL